MNSPIIGMLHNTAKNTFHPILFLNHPTPSGMDRYKSKVHHTNGFADRNEAIQSAETDVANLAKNNFGTPQFCLEKDFPWDGQGIPAMVIFFGEQDGKIVPMF